MQPSRLIKGGAKRTKPKYNTSKGFFGVPLDNEAPAVLCDAIAYIRHRGLYETGIFRIPGNMDVVNILKETYDATFPDEEAKLNSKVSVLGDHKPLCSVNDVASLLKAFFKDLNSPLIPQNTTAALVEVTQSGCTPKQEIEMFSKIVKRIPSPNRECLGLLISFLREIASFKKFNHMNADNLATCFVLSIMASDAPMGQLALLQTGAGVIKKLISAPVKLYMPSVSTVKKNTRYINRKDEPEGAPTFQAGSFPDLDDFKFGHPRYGKGADPQPPHFMVPRAGPLTDAQLGPPAMPLSASKLKRSNKHDGAQEVIRFDGPKHRAHSRPPKPNQDLLMSRKYNGDIKPRQAGSSGLGSKNHHMLVSDRTYGSAPSHRSNRGAGRLNSENSFNSRGNHSKSRMNVPHVKPRAASKESIDPFPTSRNLRNGKVRKGNDPFV